MQSKEVKKWQDEEALRRYQMIAPLLDEDLDEAKRRQLREEIAEKYEISKRSLYRYEAKYREDAFSGIRPMNREKRRSQALPENYDEIVGEAIQLKREVPKRSVRQIIKILEIEGYATPGVLKASTLSDGTLWEGQIALYFRWTCLPDCAVPELDADYRRNNRRLS